MQSLTKAGLLASAVFTTTLLASNVTNAEHPGDASGIFLSPGIGYYNFDSNREADDDVLQKIGVGYRFDSPWALELLYLEADTDDGGDDVKYKQWRLDGLYNFHRSGNLQPYLAFGAGHADFDWDDFSTHNESVINAGGGLKYYLTKALALRADARAINSLDEGDIDLAFTLGVAYHFGTAKAAPTPPPAPVDDDTDKDGVPNSIDQCPNTSPGAKVDDRGCYIILKEKVVIDLNIEFEFDSTDNHPVAKEKVQEVATFIKEYPLTNVTIEGHTDSMGSAEYNQKLSQRRAQKVADVLISEYGVDPNRISVAGFGEEQPIADNSTAEGRQTNRRVSAVFESTVAKILK